MGVEVPASTALYASRAGTQGKVPGTWAASTAAQRGAVARGHEALGPTRTARYLLVPTGTTTARRERLWPGRASQPGNLHGSRPSMDARATLVLAPAPAPAPAMPCTSTASASQAAPGAQRRRPARPAAKRPVASGQLASPSCKIGWSAVFFSNRTAPEVLLHCLAPPPRPPPTNSDADGRVTGPRRCRSVSFSLFPRPLMNGPCCLTGCEGEIRVEEEAVQSSHQGSIITGGTRGGENKAGHHRQPRHSLSSFLRGMPSRITQGTRALDRRVRNAASGPATTRVPDTGGTARRHRRWVPGILLRGGALWLSGIPGLQGMTGWSVVGATGEQGAWPGQAMCPSRTIVE